MLLLYHSGLEDVIRDARVIAGRRSDRVWSGAPVCGRLSAIVQWRVLVRFCVAVVVSAAGALAWPAPSTADVCGNGERCKCGDLVRGVAVLDRNLGTCRGSGLSVSAGSLLDCAGHTITGTNELGDSPGIELDGVTGAT